MFSFPALLFLLTLSVCSKDGLRGVEGGRSFVLPQDLLNYRPRKARGVSATPAVLDTAFTLRVQVKNAVSHQLLSEVSVDVFAHYTLISSTKTSSDGSSVLSIPYAQGRALTLVASKDGYIQTALPWKTTKRPIFSSVTLSLFSQHQGNIWLFEDSVLITGKTSDSMPQPNVQFPKSLLSLPVSNISSLTAYLTGPQKHYFPYTTGIIVSKSGYRSIELKPVAAVSVQLLCNGGEVQVTGPIQITLPLSESSQSKPSDTIPAWSFNRKTGAWVNRGLGTVKKEDSRLVWVYVAPHLGYWIAAPFPSPTGYMGGESTLDFIPYHTHLLMATLGGTLVIAIGLFGVVTCYCRDSLCKLERKRVSSTTKAVQKKDQTTYTNNSDHLDISFKNPEHSPEERSHTAASQSTCQKNRSVNCEIKGNFSTFKKKSGLPALHIYENFGGIVAESSKPLQQPHLCITSSELVMPVSLNENIFLPESLVLYNQPVAILQVPEGFRSSGKASGSRSATLPRKVVQYENLKKPVSKDTFAQTLPKPNQLSDIQQQLKEEVVTMKITYGDPGLSSSPGGWSCFNGLLESVSVPGTLNEAVGMDSFCEHHQGISEQTLLELSKSKPFPHPRAWFVSLEGKPAAQVRHSVRDLRRSHLLTDSNDTSLDSGVDLNEQQSARKHVRSMAQSRPLCSEDVDLSSSESGTTTACSPEEPILKNTLHSSSGTISNLPEDRQPADMSKTREGSECATSSRVHRIGKSKEKGRVDTLKNTWHLREERPLWKLN
ncbi:protein FAM171B-like [Pygocentrus nattereri]|uniref:Protein FAM171B n=1 Tax=Pygocentrus nattereri TaxID=42514 RepID=A0A3B4E0A2_PYGNA|nr:protein FAM171B-like [Pygocentrus nattereri]